MKRYFTMFAAMLIAGVVRGGEAVPFALPSGIHQVILAVSDDWNSTSITLRRFVFKDNAWIEEGTPWDARIGKYGLAWGIGMHPSNLSGPVKKEGDGRAPAGVFRIGDAYGYEDNVPVKPGMEYHKVTDRDLWVEDPNSTFYNQHVRLHHAPETPWEKDQQMRQNDPAHKLKLFIKHNCESRPKAGGGSSIFFHIWRNDGAKPSYGCVVLAEENLRSLIQWVNPAESPVLVMLPKDVYEEKRKDWNLP